MTDERIERLEHRIRLLEELLQHHLAEAPTPPRVLAPFVRPPRPSFRERLAGYQSASPVPVEAGPLVVAPLGVAPHDQSAEQVIGLRGVLAVGVGLVLLAAIFGLKWAIDQGYISPLVRCIGGTLLGAALGAFGWRQYQRGLRKYGAILIGTGAAVIYLVLWAAGAIYGLIQPLYGVDLLGLLSLAVAIVAYRLNEEGLGFVAAFAGIMAPVLVPTAAPTTTYLLLYLATVTAALGQVAWSRRWRRMLDLVAIGFVLSAVAPSHSAAPLLTLSCTVLFGVAGLLIGKVSNWPEQRLLGFGGGWLLLMVAGTSLDHPWWTAVGAVLMTSPVWFVALRSPSAVWPDMSERGSGATWSLPESAYFYLTPALLAPVIVAIDPAWFQAHPAYSSLFVAIPYLLAGYQRPRIPFALAGVFLTIATLMAMLGGTQLTWALLGIVVMTASFDRPLERRDGRWYSLVALFAVLQGLAAQLALRGEDATAFLDPWALTLWATIVVLVALARGLWAVYPDERPELGELLTNTDLLTPEGLRRTVAAMARHMVSLLWVVAGGLLFLGVSQELAHWMGQRGFSPETAALAGGLAVSAWWAFSSGALVSFGFRKSLAAVRVAGLCVAGMAVYKVLLVDLAQLSALYRIASFLILGLVLLGVAWLYHRQARELRQLSGTSAR